MLSTAVGVGTGVIFEEAAQSGEFCREALRALDLARAATKVFFDAVAVSDKVGLSAVVPWEVAALGQKPSADGAKKSVKAPDDLGASCIQDLVSTYSVPAETRALGAPAREGACALRTKKKVQEREAIAEKKGKMPTNQN